MASVTTDQRLGVNSSLAIKAPCDVCSRTNITLSGEQTIDGITTSSSRVLVGGQTDASENGIYDSKTGAWTRAADWDGASDIVTGTSVYVYQGTSNKGYWEVTTTGSITIGTTSVAVAQAIPGGSNAQNVQYTPAGTGAEATDVQTQLKHGYVNVMDFGAVADCTTSGSGADNQSAFQKAAEAAVELGYKAVYVPGGLGKGYRISSTVYTGVSFIGENVTNGATDDGTTIFPDENIVTFQVGATSGGSFDAPAGVTQMPKGTNIEGVTFKDLKFEGSNSWTTGSCIVRNVAGEMFRLHRIFSNNMGGRDYSEVEQYAQGSTPAGIGFGNMFKATDCNFGNSLVGNGGATDRAIIYLYGGSSPAKIESCFFTGVQAFDDNSGSPLKPDDETFGIITASVTTALHVDSCGFEKLATAINHNGTSPLTVTSCRSEQVKTYCIQSNRDFSVRGWRMQNGNLAPTVPFYVGTNCETCSIRGVGLDGLGTTAGGTPTSHYQKIDKLLEIEANSVAERLDVNLDLDPIFFDPDLSPDTARIAATSDFGLAIGQQRGGLTLVADAQGGVNEGDLAPDSTAANVRGRPLPRLRCTFPDDTASTYEQKYNLRPIPQIEIATGATNPIMQLDDINDAPVVAHIVWAATSTGKSSIYETYISSLNGSDATSTQWAINTSASKVDLGGGVVCTMAITDTTSSTAEITITQSTGVTVTISVISSSISNNL